MGGRIAHAILKHALDADLVVVRLVGLVGQERGIEAVKAFVIARGAGRAHGALARRNGLIRRERVDAAAPEALRPGGVHEIGLVELVGSVDLPQRPLPFVAEAVARDESGAVEEQAGLLGLRHGLLEQTGAAGEAPIRGQVPGQLAEQRHVPEGGLDVADVGLIQGIGNAVDDGSRRLFAGAAH